MDAWSFNSNLSNASLVLGQNNGGGDLRPQTRSKI